MPNALVTGASGSLGSAIVQELIDNKWDISASIYSKPLPAFASHKLLYVFKYDAQHHSTIEPYELKVPVNLVVFAHGVPHIDGIQLATDYTWDKVININLKSCALIVADLKNRGLFAPNSLIVFCGSIQAAAPRKGRMLYAVSKKGLEALADCINAEYAPDIRAVCLRMGHLDTIMSGISVDHDYIRERAPMGIISRVSIAKLILTIYNTPGIVGTINVDAGHLKNIW